MPFVTQEEMHMTSCCWKIKQDEYKQDDEMNTQDLSQEMSDLMTVYINAYENSSHKTEVLLSGLICGMKAFIESYETTQQVKEKMETLGDKLGFNQCDDCEEDSE